MNITINHISIFGIGIITITTFGYSIISGNPLNDGLIYTGIAAISGLSGFELGGRKE